MTDARCCFASQLALAVVLVWFGWTGAAAACAPAPADDMTVSVNREEALIIWDEANKRQHFIRRADFSQRQKAGGRSSAKDFGFIVPTPSKPELTEAPDAVFARLARHIRPRIERYNEYEVAWTLCGGMYLAGSEDAAGARGEASAVMVLDEKRVAGLDAAVLKASDADALAQWLKGHGYAFRPALRDWLSVYVEQGWIVTAFKIAAGGPKAERPGGIGSAAVRMSFAAEVPFFPYREPSDQEPVAGRRLGVFFVGPSKVKGSLGAGEKSWGAELLFAAPLQEAESLLAGVLPNGQLPSKLWLSAYVDKAQKRSAAGDLVFAAAPAGPFVRVQRRARTVTLPIFLDVIVFLALLGGGVFTWRRRRRTG